MGVQDRLDYFGGWVLIYEGSVLAARRVRPGMPTPPAVSDLVWKVPRQVRWCVAGGICGYLLLHFMTGPRPKLPTLTAPA